MRTASGASRSSTPEWDAVLQIHVPADPDPTVRPLYVADRFDSGIHSAGIGRGGDESPFASSKRDRRESSEHLDTRGAYAELSSSLPAEEHDSVLHVVPNTYLSFATFFNAFPAAYWRRWTDVPRVRLHLELEGVADLRVYRSTPRGTNYRIDGRVQATGVIDFDISLKPFGDGGWLWFDLVSHAEDVRVVSAVWLVESQYAQRQGRLAIAITTFNRPDDCITQIRRIAKDATLQERLESMIFVDQGTQLVEEQKDFAEAAGLLGSRLKVVRQGNLGGSGGFARGMLEGAIRGEADYVMLLDDDVLIETESISRALKFADYTRQDTIVGGHMLNLLERSVVNNFGEEVTADSMAYRAVVPDSTALDLAVHGLRSTKIFHRRIDVGYNGWWMCLIPRGVVSRVGLSLPTFIKWDDVEYGMRAARAGVATVTLPGAAVWHMPWTEKDDRLDWQAYYHQRNRWLVALLYSPHRGGGRLAWESRATDLKHILSMQYGPADLRLRALRDVLSGPAHLHETLESKAREVRALRASYTDGKVIDNPVDYPDIRGYSSAPPVVPKSSFLTALRVLRAIFRHAVSQNRLPENAVNVWVPAEDARWWRLSALDGAVVSTADGTGVTVYRRDRARFLSLLWESHRLHRRLRRRWDRLASEYRAAHEELVSPDQWLRTFVPESEASQNASS